MGERGRAGWPGLAAVAAALVGCGALQVWLRPGAAVEVVRYRHRGVPFWERVLYGHVELPLDFPLGPEQVVAAVRALVLAAGAVFALLLVWRARDVLSVAGRELLGRGSDAPPAESPGGRPLAWTGHDTGAVLGLFAAFLAVYLGAGLALESRHAFRVTDVLFENDTPRVVKDIAVHEARHLRTQVHPVYVLLVNPIGSFVARWTPSPNVAAVLVNSFLAALGVALAHVFFRLRGGSEAVSALLAVVFGLSTSQFLFGAVPSTQSLSVCTLVLSYGCLAWCLERRRLHLRAWVVVGALSLGVTTTNLVQTVACFAAAAFSLAGDRREDLRAERRRALARVLTLVVAAVAITSGLALVQKRIYPETNLFFLPGSYGGEHENFTLLVLAQPLTVLVQVAKHFFLVNLVAPAPSVWALMQRVFPALTFASSWSFNAFGAGAALLWLGLLGSGAAAFLRQLRRAPAFPAAIGASLVFNLLLHSLYGVGEKDKIEFLEFAGNFTFLVLIVASTRVLASRGRVAVTWLLVLAALMAVNDAMLLRQLLGLYGT